MILLHNSIFFPLLLSSYPTYKPNFTKYELVQQLITYLINYEINSTNRAQSCPIILKYHNYRVPYFKNRY